MKKYFMFFIVFVIFMCPSFVLGKDISFGNIAIESNGEDSFLIPTNSIETTDGYVVIGMDNLFKAFIAKMDSNGQILWNYTTGLFYTFHDVVVGNDGNYVVAAACNDASHACLFKINTNGELLWEVRYGNTSRGDSFNSIIKVSDGYIVAGTAYSENIPVDKAKGSADGIIAKYDENGNLLWEKIYGGSMIDKFNGMIATSDGGYLAYGITRSSDIDGLNFNDQVDRKILVKYDSSFNILWQKEFVDAQSNSLDKIVEDDDGTLIMLGSKDPNTNQSDAFIYKLNSNGELIWRKTFVGDGDDTLINVVIEDDCYVVLGTTTSTDLFSENMSNATNTFSGIIVYDKDGWQLTMKAYESDGYDRFMSMNKIDEYKYHILGIRAVPIDESAYNFYISSLTAEILYDVDGYETMHGTYELKQSGGKLVVIPKPDNGYIVNGVFVSKQSNSEEYIPYTKVGNEYHFIINESVNVSVVFKKNKNESVLFNKIWSQKENSVFVGEEKYFSKIYSPVYKNSNGILMYENLTTAGGITGKLKQIDFSGNVKKEKSLNNYFIISLVEGNDCFYAIAITMDDSKNYFLKIDNNLNIVESKNITESINIFDFSFSNVYGFDLFVFNENKLYLATVNALYVYDSSFNPISTITDKDGDFCSIIPSYCMLNLELLDGMNIRGYDILGEKVAVVGDVYNSENDRYGYLSLIKDGEELLEKKFDNYYSIMNVVLLQDYIVITAEKSEVEIIILDYSGNIIQTIYESSGMFNLTKNGSGFFVVNVGYVSEANNSCEYYEPCFLYSVDYYDLSPTISIVGDNKNNIEIVSNAKPGETVTVDVDNKFGYTFEGLKIIDANGNVTIVNTNSFVMPDTPITVEPIFSPIVNPDTGTFISISVVILSLIGLFSYYFLKKVKVKKFST